MLGYVGRLLIRTNPFLESWFLLYLICLTIGPTVGSALYLFVDIERDADIERVVDRRGDLLVFG